MIRDTSISDSASLRPFSLHWAYPLSALLAVAMVYILTLAMLPRHGFWIVDNGCKFIQMESIIRSDYDDFSIDWPGAKIDPDFEFNPLGPRFGHVREGKLYGTFAPFFPMVSTFPYRLWGMTGLYVIPFLGGLLTLTAVWKLASLFSAGQDSLKWSPFIAILLAGLATPIWFYSVAFWEHTPASGLACWSFVFFVRYLRDPRLMSLVLAGLFCAGSIYFRDDLYVFAAMMALFKAIASPKKWPNALIFSAVTAVGLIPLWWFQWNVLGNPLGYHFTPTDSTSNALGQFIANRWLVLRHIFFDVGEDEWWSLLFTLPVMGLWLRRVCVPCKSESETESTRASSFVEVAGFGLLGGAVVLYFQIFAPSQPQWLLTSNSIFAASPMLILAFLNPNHPVNTGDEAWHSCERVFRLTHGFLLFYAVLYAMLSPEIHAKGVHWACRYLLTLYPILAVVVAYNLVAWWSSGQRAGIFRRSILVALVLLSIGSQLYALRLMDEMKTFWVRLNSTVDEHGEAHIVTSAWWIPMELSDGFFDRSIYLDRSDESFSELRRKLRRRGVRKLTIIKWPPRKGAEVPGNVVVEDNLSMFGAELETVDLP